jgi:hypothetical protein
MSEGTPGMTHLDGRAILLRILPPSLVDGLRVVRAYARYAGCRGLLQANLKWKDRYSGERVYVIANGPSVAGVDRRILSSERLIVMNNFHLAAWKDDVRPVAHCMGEPPGSPSWMDPSPMINGTRSDSYWFISAARGLATAVEPGKEINYVLAGTEPRMWGKWKIHLDKPTLGFQTTAQMAIEVALYMGFKDIRLLGFDHDWLASPQYSKHFYSDEKDPEDALGERSYFELIQYSMRMWEAYFALAKAAQAHGATITNMTDGSFLDVFPRRKPPQAM